MRKLFQKLFLGLSMGVLIGISYPASGQAQASYNDIIFPWYSTKTSCSTAQGGSSSPEIYIVGDSLTVGMRDSGDLSAKLTSKGWVVKDIEATGGDTVTDALPKIDSDAQIINAIKEKGGTVVVALGTNKESNFGAKIAEVVNRVKGAQIFWMNAWTKAANYDDINASIANQASPLGYKVIDWKTEVTSNPAPYPFTPEGVHHTTEGYRAKSDFLVSALGSPTATTSSGSGSLQGKDNLEKAWRFLTGKGLSPEQTAGIMGNLMVESGLNPFNEENGYEGQDRGGKGIAQWTATRRVDFESKAAVAGVITREAPYNALPEGEKGSAMDKALLFNLNFLWEEATMRGDIEKLKAESIGDTPEKRIENAVISWERWYERAGKPALGARYTEALKVYQLYSDITGSAVGVSAECGGVSGSSADGQRIAEIALREVGIKEGDSNCNKYLLGQGTCTSIQWCAAFTGWVYKEAGLPTGGGFRAKGVGQWFEENKFFFRWNEPYRPQVGDVFVKGRGSSGTGWGGIGHNGIVVSVNNFTIETVEGNSSNMVAKRTYEDYRSIPQLIGFGRYTDKGSVPAEPGFDPSQGAGGVYAPGIED